jgi:hypothetical protein
MQARALHIQAHQQNKPSKIQEQSVKQPRSLHTYKHLHVLVPRMRGQPSESATDSNLKAFHHQTIGKVGDFRDALCTALKRVCTALQTAPEIFNQEGFKEYDTWLQMCKRLRESRSMQEIENHSIYC